MGQGKLSKQKNWLQVIIKGCKTNIQVAFSNALQRRHRNDYARSALLHKTAQVNTNFCHFASPFGAALSVERAANGTAERLRMIKPRSKLSSEADAATGGRKRSNGTVRRPASVIA